LIDAVERFDGEALMASSAMPSRTRRRALRREVAAPLLVEIGDRWADGRGSVADERLVSGVLRNLLGSLVAGARAARGVESCWRRHTASATTSASDGRDSRLDAGLSVYYLAPTFPRRRSRRRRNEPAPTYSDSASSMAANRARAVAAVRAIHRAPTRTTEMWVGGADAAGWVKALRSKRLLAIANLDAVDAELRRVARAGLRPPAAVATPDAASWTAAGVRLLRDVGSARSGSSGHGCFGYRPRSSRAPARRCSAKSSRDRRSPAWPARLGASSSNSSATRRRRRAAYAASPKSSWMRRPR
jgi:hypothetical protein